MDDLLIQALHPLILAVFLPPSLGEFTKETQSFTIAKNIKKLRKYLKYLFDKIFLHF